MNIFLDSNPIYRDPFMEKGYNKILNKLAKHDNVKIYMSRVVYEEVFRGHKDFLSHAISNIKNQINKIRPYLENYEDEVNVNIELDKLLDDLKECYEQLSIESKLEIIEYDVDILNFIVDIDMSEKEPFIKKDNKKKEIRDAIIWYSYQIFIEKNKLKECYFISNNTQDFGDEDAKNTPQNQPYNIHPQLSPSSLTAYRNAQEFLNDNDTQVKEFFIEINKQILSEELYDKVYEELEEGLAEELTTKFFIEQISTNANDYLSNMQPDDIHMDYFMSGIVMPTGEFDISEVSFVDVDIYGDDITVSIDVDVELPVEIHLYNPVYDDKEDKFQYHSTDTIRVTQNVVFNIPADFEKELEETKFSFKEYIDGHEPENVEIDIIEYKNIDHVDMFPEEEYEGIY